VAENLQPGANIRPDVADVGRLLSYRTVDRSGVEQGTFTFETRPTVDQVEDLIDVEVAQTLLDIDLDLLPDAQIPQAEHLAAVRAAMLVEGSYYVDSSDPGSWRSQLGQMYKDGIQALDVATHGGVKIF
jgi:hypothetical protein